MPSLAADVGVPSRAGRKSSKRRRPQKPQVKPYPYLVTATAAAELNSAEAPTPLDIIAEKSGANVQLDFDSSPLQGYQILLIQGDESQIEKAIRLISQHTGAEGTVSEQAEQFWLRWVEDAFPDFESRTYFLPPIHVNLVPTSRMAIAGEDVQVLQVGDGQAAQNNQTSSASAAVPTSQPPPVNNLSSSYESKMRDDAATQRVLLCFQKMAERNQSMADRAQKVVDQSQNEADQKQKEAFIALSQLEFLHYLSDPCYGAATAQMQRASTFPGRRQRGDFDLLVIHRWLGLVICEVKAVGDNFRKLNSSEQTIDETIRKKLEKAVSQLKKGKEMLSHLLSDIAPGPRITRTIAVPNLTSGQVKRAIGGDQQLTTDLCECLGATDAAQIPGLCLCSDQLSDPGTPWGVSDGTLRKVRSWWEETVARSGPDTSMTVEVYKKLAARFCGPATTVTVACTSAPRWCLKTLGQAVSLTGECYVQITLFPEQVDLLNRADPLVFLAGPPGTGKTLMLQLMGMLWLGAGKQVHVISTTKDSYASCCLLHHQLQYFNRDQTGSGTRGQPHLLQYNFNKQGDVDNALNDLRNKAAVGSLHVLVDEAGSERGAKPFQKFCEDLLAQVRGLHLWAASYYHRHCPRGWELEYLLRPLRCPPAVAREVELDAAFTRLNSVAGYQDRGVPDYTESLTIKTLYHEGPGHSYGLLVNCAQCGREVAALLHGLRVGASAPTPAISSTTSPPRLQWKDVLVLSRDRIEDSWGFLGGMAEAGIPLKVVRTDDDVKGVALAIEDVVWVAEGIQVRGLERKIIVCTWNIVNAYARLHIMARCTSQLVLVSHRPPRSVSN